MMLIGNWSGSIGWYDVAPEQREIALRADSSHTLNMRLSFQTRHDDDTIADWIVYHARSQGSKDHVVLEKHGEPSEHQAFYCFVEGIVGRMGRNILAFPVVEHGFWADGMRRTVVLVYTKKLSDNSSESSHQCCSLERICFLQQAKQPEQQEFDVSATNLADIAVLPKGPWSPRPLNAQEKKKLLAEWRSPGTMTHRVEELDGFGGSNRQSSVATDSSSCDDALGYLFRSDDDDDDILRIQLPNGVVIACPWFLKKGSSSSGPVLRISLGYKRPSPCGQIQILDMEFDPSDGSLQTVRAHWYDKEKEEKVV